MGTGPFRSTPSRSALIGVVCAALLAPGAVDAAGTRCRVRLSGGSSLCGLKAVSEREISEAAGLGRIEVAGKIGAVLGRDEGEVTLLDLSDRSKPKPLGSYDDDIPDSFDGDLAFSDDGRWLFYARQTHQFSKDGLHVLDVADPEAPSLAHYSPAGGAFRVAYHEDEAGAWVFLLDAIDGFVVYRFEPTTGVVIPVHVDALPALKVGGPASAGISIDRKDPVAGGPLAYVTTGTTGLQVFDISDPSAPTELGSWAEAGLAEVEVRATKGRRLVYVAPEYWFGKSAPSEVIVLDATDLGDIRVKGRFALPDLPEVDAQDAYRLQGMALAGDRLYVAHSSAGLVAFDLAGGRIVAAARRAAARNEGAAPLVAPYAMDVEVAGGLVYLTDGATGRLTTFQENT